MKTDIAGRCALVMGASKGIGRAIAEGLANEGASICIVARDEKTLKQTATNIQKNSSARVFSISADLSQAGDIDSAYKFARDKMGKVDILINNAGGPKFGTLQTLTEKDWNDAINLTLLSTVRMTSLAVPSMIEKKWGRIVTVTSTIAKEPTPTMILSSTMRAGVTAFMKSLSIGLAPEGVTVNVAAPGGVLTDRLKDLVKTKAQADKVSYEELLRDNEKTIPFGRFATPEEFAAYVVFLCSEQARYITGTSLNVDGGLSKGIF